MSFQKSLINMEDVASIRRFNLPFSPVFIISFEANRVCAPGGELNLHDDCITIASKLKHLILFDHNFCTK